MSPSTPESVSTRNHRRLSWLAVPMFAMAAVLLTGCLGPNDPDPTGNAPIGNIDSAVAMGTSVRVTGWTIDPNTTSPVYVSMRHRDVDTRHLANARRHDVAKVYPKYGERHGFDITTPSSGVNARETQVCLWVENVGAGRDDRLLGCRTVALRSDNAAGHFDSVTAVNPRLVRIAGWGLDPETTGPVKVRYSVDGGTPVEVTANRPRPDVNRAVGVAGDHGFVADIPVVVGSHRICVTVVNIGRGNSANLGCKVVLTESVTPVGPGADLLSVSIVGPKGGHPLAETDRDAGVSTVLGDGSVLWLFGDTSGWNPDGTIKYFINNTAAWAPAGRPTDTTDGVAAGGQPHQFVYPVVVPPATSPFTEPCKANWKAAMWPMSAVAIAEPGVSDPRLQHSVVIFMGNVCMGGAWQMESRGVSVVEWTYDPANPPMDKPITGRVVNQNLFGAGDEYGTAAYFDGSYIKAYKCGRPGDDGQIHFFDDPAYGPCTVARVAPGRAGDRSAWEFWTGRPEAAWGDASAAAPMVVPGVAGNPQMPVAAFSVHKDSAAGVSPAKYLMTYSPWPGLTPSVYVRSAESDTGPWSAPREYQLPGCLDSAGGKDRFCYAAIAQPALSTTTTLGIGYFDQLIGLGPARGGYLAGTFARPAGPPRP